MPRLPTVFFAVADDLDRNGWRADLTDEERSWLAAHPQLRLGVDASWPPFEFRDQEGRYQGLAADYIALIRRRLA
jgi:ABC-type amino acid transport substrate-binding protein